VAGVAVGSTGYIAAITIGSIAARSITGSSAFGGAPGAAAVAGAAVGSAILSWIMARRGRRVGLVLGYLVSASGALLAALSISAASLPLLIGATVLIGFGNSANQLSRYAAADLFGPERRASTIGLVVWGATVGAVVGPNVVQFAGDAASAAGLPDLTGPYLFLAAFVSLACVVSFVMLRPDPFELADASALAGPGSVAAAPLVEVVRRPAVTASIVALVIGQVVMTLIMTMTPLHMTEHGHSLAMVGLVISGHTFGMFALSPISGRMTDRFGHVRVIFFGTLVLATSAILAAVAPPDGGNLLFVALFLLGWGWNLGFVAGSSLLSGGVTLAERTRVQGVADATIWSAAAFASVGSGLVVAAAGFATLGLLGAALVLLPVWVLAAHRSRLREAV
jgi:MFS family permease